MSANHSSARWTRREALSIFGLGAAAATLPRVVSAAAPQFPKGAIIRTILKDMKPEELAGGATLFHEHMSFPPDFMTRWTQYARETAARNGRGAGAQGAQGGSGRQGGRQGGAAQAPAAATPSNEPYFMQDLDLMTEEMRAAAKDGVACIVDGGHPDMGRDFDFLKQLSIKSGLPIVAGCGFYTQPFYPKEISTWSEEQILEDLIRQANSQPVGAFGEIGSWDEITDDERKVFRAVGKAQVATNLPIFTHTGIPGKSAMEQLDLLESAGAKPEHIVIGHLGNLVDPKIEVQKAICKRGAFIGFDRQGGPGDARQVPMVLALLEAGYANNLMFASDFSAAQQLKKNGGPGYAKTLTVWLPKLREAGVSDEILHGIMVDNSRRFLAFVPKKKRAA